MYFKGIISKMMYTKLKYILVDIFVNLNYKMYYYNWEKIQQENWKYNWTASQSFKSFKRGTGYVKTSTE